MQIYYTFLRIAVQNLINIDENNDISMPKNELSF